MTGRLVFDPDEPRGRGPSKFRIATYCSGSGDDRRSAFVTVKSFDHETVASLAKGQMVRVVGRLDPWTPEGSKTNVLDVMADDDGGIELVERDDNGSQRRQPAQARSGGRGRPAPSRGDYDPDESF